jgi:hypothetical protein
VTYTVDARIARCDLERAARGIVLSPWLRLIQMYPPASGPEVELTYAVSDARDGADAENSVRHVLAVLAVGVLASRHREVIPDMPVS